MTIAARSTKSLSPLSNSIPTDYIMSERVIVNSVLVHMISDTVSFLSFLLVIMKHALSCHCEEPMRRSNLL